MGGFGSAVLECLEDTAVRVLRVGIPDRFIDHGKREILLEDAGLTAPQIAARTIRAAGAGTRVLLTEG